MSGFRKHVEGWQAGLLVLLLAGTAIVFVSPRAAEPQVLPEPAVNQEALDAVIRNDDAAAARAEQDKLDVDVRRLGSAMRAYNQVAVAADADALVDARGKVVGAASAAVARSVSQTLALRAYQMRQFLAALKAWTNGADSASASHVELLALGGDFLSVLKRSGWCEANSRRLRADEAVLRAMFKKRWNDVSGIKGEGFDLSEDEDRLRYGFLIAHPFVPSGSPTPVKATKRRRQLLAGQLRLIARLGERDPSYPADIARGVLFYQGARYADSVSAFQRWLSKHPDGPYTLRARNHLKASIDAARRVGF